MKLPPLEYARPTTVDQAIAALRVAGAVALAGGHSLLPQLSQRRRSATVLVDLNRVEGLAEITVADDRVRVGALVRQRELETSALLAEHAPLIRLAAKHVATPVIRNRGTIGGSLVNADVGAELVVALFALDASAEIASATGTRVVAVRDIVVGPNATSLAPGELVTAIHVPVHGAAGFAEISTRPGDYPDASAAALGHASGTRVAVGGVASLPFVADLGTGEDPATTLAALVPEANVHASSRARRHMAITATRRAIAQAHGHREEAA